MASQFKMDMAKLITGISKADTMALDAILMYGDTAATKLEGWMKNEAPWTDRTAQARQRLSTSAEKTSEGIRIALMHGVDYGVFLEFAHEQRYAIIEPTIRLHGPEVLQGYQGLLDGLGIGI